MRNRLLPNASFPPGLLKLSALMGSVVVVASLLAYASPASPQPDDPNEWASGASWFAKRAVERNLKDPDSASFRDVYTYAGSSADDRWVCGSVNAKNGFGGYVGFNAFAAHVTVTDRNPPNGGTHAETSVIFASDDVTAMVHCGPRS